MYEEAAHYRRRRQRNLRVNPRRREDRTGKGKEKEEKRHELGGLYAFAPRQVDLQVDGQINHLGGSERSTVCEGCLKSAPGNQVSDQ